MQNSTINSSSPSFNSYSSEKLTEIAARVVEEFNQEQHGPSSEAENDTNIFNWNDLHVQKTQEPQECEEYDDDQEFEFAVVYKDQDGYSPISADEIFYNGQIKPTYPVFNKDIMFFQDNRDANASSASQPTIRLPLSKLFREEQRQTTTASCSSSEAGDDELEGVQPGTYCVWKPKAEQCKKSNSTGSSNSKRWKFKDLLHRSNSDGKETFVFLTPLTKKITDHKEKKGHHGNSGVGDGKKKTYLPYKHDILGLFSNVNGLSRNLHPF